MNKTIAKINMELSSNYDESIVGQIDLLLKDIDSIIKCNITDELNVVWEINGKNETSSCPVVISNKESDKMEIYDNFNNSSKMTYLFEAGLNPKYKKMYNIKGSHFAELIFGILVLYDARRDKVTSGLSGICESIFKTNGNGDKYTFSTDINNRGFVYKWFPIVWEALKDNFNIYFPTKYNTELNKGDDSEKKLNLATAIINDITSFKIGDNLNIIPMDIGKGIFDIEYNSTKDNECVHRMLPDNLSKVHQISKPYQAFDMKMNLLIPVNMHDPKYVDMEYLSSGFVSDGDIKKASYVFELLFVIGRLDVLCMFDKDVEKGLDVIDTIELVCGVFSAVSVDHSKQSYVDNLSYQFAYRYFPYIWNKIKNQLDLYFS